MFQRVVLPHPVFQRVARVTILSCARCSSRSVGFIQPAVSTYALFLKRSNIDCDARHRYGGIAFASHARHVQGFVQLKKKMCYSEPWYGMLSVVHTPPNACGLYPCCASSIQTKHATGSYTAIIDAEVDSSPPPSYCRFFVYPVPKKKKYAGNKASLLLLKNNNGNGRAGAGARVSSEGETPARGPAQPLPTGDIPAAEIAIKDTSAAAVGGGGSLRLTLNEREPEETRSARGSGPEQQGTVSVIKVDGRLPPLLAPLRPPEVEKIITGQKEGEKKNQNSGADAGGATETNLKGGGADNDIAPLTDVTVAGGEEREELGIEVVATAAAVSPKKSQREKEETCLLMMASLNIEPDRSWGKANKSEQKLWDSLMCNSAVHQVRTIDCTER